jgi:hypothetical protein
MIHGAQPPLDHVVDLVRVLLQHHHVAVAVNADIGEADKGGLHPGLREVAHGAMVVRGVVGRFRRHDQDWRVLHIDKLVGPIPLRPAARNRVFPAYPPAFIHISDGKMHKCTR